MSPPSPSLQALLDATRNIVDNVVYPMARQVDSLATWPEHSMRAFADAGLTGLQAPTRVGGHGEGLLALAMITELIARACPSSALCFGMHCVGTAVIAAKATASQEERYLRPIAEGRHLTTLALSESGTGAHFYLPETRLDPTPDGTHFSIKGTKQFVTNGGKADSYVVSTCASSPQAEAGDFSCLVVDAGTANLEWLEPWEGFGMRGNNSRGLRLDDAVVPVGNLLGEDGDEVWYVFEVVAPYFLIAMAGTYLGVAQSALDAAGEQLRNRRHTHSGAALRESEVLQARYADMWIAVEKTRALIYEAARRGDMGDPTALPYILACKADAGDTAVHLANEAMTVCGGSAYRDNSRVAQILRDARASHVMSPTTDLLKLWAGRSLLGLPLL